VLLINKKHYQSKMGSFGRALKTIFFFFFP
jgi:hypothetical protein